MMHTVAGLFETHRTADLVVEHLVQEYGIPRERVRVHARDPTGAAEARSPQDSDQGASLSDLGLPEETVRAYAEGTSRGGILVAAQLEGSRVERIVAAYQEYGAAEVHARETEWRSQAGRWSTCFLS
jgi:hypothetical protein